jgi:hypothetical protein
MALILPSPIQMAQSFEKKKIQKWFFTTILMIPPQAFNPFHVNFINKNELELKVERP